METIKLKAHIGSDGILRVETPSTLRNTDTDVVILLQPVNEVDAMGYPVGYFEETYGSFADEPIERGEQGSLNTRDNDK